MRSVTNGLSLNLAGSVLPMPLLTPALRAVDPTPWDTGVSFPRQGVQEVLIRHPRDACCPLLNRMRWIQRWTNECRDGTWLGQGRQLTVVEHKKSCGRFLGTKAVR